MTKEIVLKRNKQKAEAINRMKMLDLYSQIIDDFKNDSVLYKSEAYGILYWLDEEERNIVSQFEEKYGAVVFHLIKSYTNFGTLLSLFYVSKHEDEWERDNAMLHDNLAFCYVVNLEDDTCSEFGSIGFKSNIGGLIRTE